MAVFFLLRYNYRTLRPGHRRPGRLVRRGCGRRAWG